VADRTALEVRLQSAVDQDAGQKKSADGAVGLVFPPPNFAASVIPDVIITAEDSSRTEIDIVTENELFSGINEQTGVKEAVPGFMCEGGVEPTVIALCFFIGEARGNYHLKDLALVAK
jgi:hypothetical protein